MATKKPVEIFLSVENLESMLRAVNELREGGDEIYPAMDDKKDGVTLTIFSSEQTFMPSITMTGVCFGDEFTLGEE